MSLPSRQTYWDFHADSYIVRYGTWHGFQTEPCCNLCGLWVLILCLSRCFSGALSVSLGGGDSRKHLWCEVSPSRRVPREGSLLPRSQERQPLGQVCDGKGALAWKESWRGGGVLRKYSDRIDFRLSAGMWPEPGVHEVRDTWRQAGQDWGGHVGPAGKVSSFLPWSQTPCPGRQGGRQGRWRETGRQGLPAGSCEWGSRFQAEAPRESENHWLLGGREVLRLSRISLKARMKKTKAQGILVLFFIGLYHVS